MIQDLDKTLEVLLTRELKSIEGLIVSFETPDDTFRDGLGKPTIDLFLYDVRENRELRDNEVHVERRMGDKGFIAYEHRAPVRVECSYLITAWGKTPQDEHMLLSKVMQVLLRYPTLPAHVLQESLERQDLEPPTSALQPGLLQSMGEFWQALGGRLKAALHYTVTLSVDVQSPEEVGPPVVDSQTNIRQIETESA